MDQDELLVGDSRASSAAMPPGRRTRDGCLTMVKILYIEDNEDNLYMLSNRLKRRGYEVVAAPDGEQRHRHGEERGARRSSSWI